ncbi:hypothetical protein [Dactylosporangium sp. NPDC000521]|uniref:hypothetical protein n=1 Tax=Dactylosporangium sp. NPDC000521 TaxID=3363975 RepID=UPI0036812D73
MRERVAIAAGLIVGPIVLALGVLWLLTFAPGVVTGGSVTTTDCGTAPRHGQTCWGDFTPRDGGPPRPVSIDDVDEPDVTVSAVMYPWAPSQAFRPPGGLTAAGSTAMTLAGGAVLGHTVTRLVRTIRRRNGLTPGQRPSPWPSRA